MTPTRTLLLGAMTMTVIAGAGGLATADACKVTAIGISEYHCTADHDRQYYQDWRRAEQLDSHEWLPPERWNPPSTNAKMKDTRSPADAARVEMFGSVEPTDATTAASCESRRQEWRQLLSRYTYHGRGKLLVEYKDDQKLQELPDKKLALYREVVCAEQSRR
ncbi:hypothetical protein [Nocardia sp. NPDC048505]|uniref:hypothetical protein n=1 Tax=unclassified Nocardia TaxID=2637762 RepID=UPI0033D80C54